jgi:hypothetical protein
MRSTEFKILILKGKLPNVRMSIVKRNDLGGNSNAECGIRNGDGQDHLGDTRRGMMQNTPSIT